MSEPATEVLIVGSALSGLVLGYRLHQAGIRVQVLEQSLRAGGSVVTFAQGDFLAEGGFSSLLGTQAVFDLIADLGLITRLVRPRVRPERFIWQRNRLLPLPNHWSALLTTPLLSVSGKLRCLGEVLVPPLAISQEETVREFVERRFGREVAEVIVAPFIAMICGGDPGQLSAQTALKTWYTLECQRGHVLRGLHKGLLTEPISLRTGLQELISALTVALGPRLCLDQQVTQILPIPGGGYQVLTKSQPPINVPVVILATPAYVGAGLLKELDTILARKLASIYYAPMVTAALAYPQATIPHPLNGWGHLLPRDQGFNSLGAVWSSSVFPDRAPPGWHLMTTWLGGALDPQCADLDTDDLIRLAAGDLAKIFGLRQEPKLVGILRREQAIPQYCLGHVDKIRYLHERLKQFPGLFLCSNYLEGITLSDAIAQANAQAPLIQKYLQANRQVSQYR